VKTQTCRFCLHAYYRVFVGDRAREAHYCPLDLYSGQEERIETALRALWDDWAESGGARNNLRVFVDGEIVRPSEASLVDAHFTCV
jgi:inositol-pentakisphosphate 2-kinase